MSSTYNKPTYGKDKDHNKDKKDCKDKHNGHSRGVIKANPQHVELEEEPQSSDEDAEVARTADDDVLWRDGYYCCVIHQAEETEHFFGVCYNCKKAGHAWQHCSEPLRPALQEIKDQTGLDNERLNASGMAETRELLLPRRAKELLLQPSPRSKYFMKISLLE